MRIDSMFGADTGMSLVDVYLETERECALSHAEIWEELRPLLAAQNVRIGGVVDFFLQMRGADGNWVGAGTLDWSER